MKTIIELFLSNLINIGYGILIFVTAYLSNALFSTYYNVKVLKLNFDHNKLIKSLFKIASIGLGTALLSISITALPVFATYVGFDIPEDYQEVFNNLVIISVYLTSACKYIFESYIKLRLIVINDNTKYENEINGSNNTTSFIDTNSQNNKMIGG